MKATSNHFFAIPHSRLGWWSVGLGVIFTVLFLLVVNSVIRFSGLLTMTIGVVAGILTLSALIWKRERSWLVWLMLLPGLFAILFAMGEILYPH